MVSSIERNIEAMIFTSTTPLSAALISDVIFQLHEEKLEEVEIEKIVDNINSRYDEIGAVFAIQRIAGGYQILSRPEYDGVISHLQSNISKKKLSNATLEVLSIVVYKQPVTKAVIEQIRGVNSDYAIQKLLEKDLIKITGRSEDVGKPLLYAAGNTFLDHFGLNNLADLPKLKEFETPEETIGIPVSEEE